MKKFEEPTMEVVRFNEDDIIVTSTACPMCYAGAYSSGDNENPLP